MAGGKTVAQVGQKLGVSEQTYYRWRQQYGGMQVDEAKRLKELEAENARLKRLVAEAELDSPHRPRDRRTGGPRAAASTSSRSNSAWT